MVAADPQRVGSDPGRYDIHTRWFAMHVAWYHPDPTRLLSDQRVTLAGAPVNDTNVAWYASDVTKVESPDEW